MEQYTFPISVLLLREGDLWIAQCLEYDIVAQAKSISQAKQSFERTFIGQIVLDLSRQKKPLEGILQAPQEVWEKFREGERLGGRQPLRIPDKVTQMLRATMEDVRVCTLS